MTKIWSKPSQPFLKKPWESLLKPYAQQVSQGTSSVQVWTKDTDEKIRAELRQYKVVVGLLTPNSLKSSYVLFELGARWGQGLFIAPIFSNGASSKNLRGPLSGFNVLSASIDEDLHQFLSDIGEKLGVQVRDAKVFTKQLKIVSELASEEAAVPAVKQPEADTMVYERPYYWKMVGESKEGPYCANCYDSKTPKLSVHLNGQRKTGVWTCPNCKATVIDSNYVAPGPIHVKRDIWDTFR